MRLFSCVFQVYNSNKDNQSEGSKYFLSARPLRRWLCCVAQTGCADVGGSAGEAELPVAVTLGCAVLPGLRVRGDGAWCGDRRWPHEKLDPTLGREPAQEFAGGAWGRGEQRRAVPWCSGVRLLPPDPHPGVPGLQQHGRGCWRPLGQAFCTSWSQWAQVASWTSQLSFLNQSWRINVSLPGGIGAKL